MSFFGALADVCRDVDLASESPPEILRIRPKPTRG
jgi:hypothetical protein